MTSTLSIDPAFAIDRLERFFEKSDGCWIWKGSRNRHGYGKITISKRTFQAHRLSYQLYVADIPTGMCICHKCDNPPCVNPNHLFIGSHKENFQDMVSKDRFKLGKNTRYAQGHKSNSGERNPMAKLTPEKVIQIKRAISTGRTARSISTEFSVGRSTVADIKSGRLWSHVSGV